MHSKPEFERRLREVRRTERFIVVPWVLLFFLAPLLLGALHRVLQNSLRFSYDAAAAVAAVMLLGSWSLPPLLLFYLRSRAGLVCPHCGPFRTPLRFSQYALRHDTCPKCKREIFAAAS